MRPKQVDINLILNVRFQPCHYLNVVSRALPTGSRILVTAANGYIASHVVDQLLVLGYAVRGTIRAPKPKLNELERGFWECDCFLLWRSHRRSSCRKYVVSLCIVNRSTSDP